MTTGTARREGSLPVRSASVQRLVGEFTDLTGRMNELKNQCRELADRREQVALQLSQTGLYLYQIGRMVGLSAPTLCRLAQKAKEKNARENIAASDGHPRTQGDHHRDENRGNHRFQAG